MSSYHPPSLQEPRISSECVLMAIKRCANNGRPLGGNVAGHKIYFPFETHFLKETFSIILTRMY